MEKLFQNTKYWILTIFLFLFPLFFLTTTQEFFITNKLYLLICGALFLIFVTGLQLFTSKKIVWQKSIFDNLLILFLITIGLSIVIVSPNKIQALLNPNFGLVGILALVILYFYISRENRQAMFFKTLSLSAFFLSILTIIFFFDPLKIGFLADNLPLSLAFLKNTNFTLMGNLLDLAIFLGFFVVWGIIKIINQDTTDKKKNILIGFLWTVNLLAFSLTIYNLFKPTIFVLPPFRISWFAAIEILKTPLNAFFGIGVDNFASIFTRVKDIAYNQSSIWQINSFTVSRSTFLHILTETGVFGLLAFVLLLITMIKQAFSKSQPSNLQLKAFVIYWLVVAFFFPSSLVVWFLFFIVLYFSSQSTNRQPPITSFNLSSFMPIYLSLIIVILIALSGSFYFLGRSYLAEMLFKKSLDGYVNNNVKDVYENLRMAIIYNPYIEKYRINFAQTNMLIANNLIAQAQQQTPASQETDQNQPKEESNLSEEDRQTITQAIQTAIAEAKSAVALNSQKSGNWENLAAIYRNVINIAQGADLWTISSYQRAIVLDPQNPNYRLGLGGVYYSLGNWEEASRFFEQAIILKSNWPNAYYNMAWASFQKKDYQKAVNAMENALRLIDPVKDKNDYDRAKSELDEFKAKLPKEEDEPPTTNNQSPSQLALPTPIPTSAEPKIELPKEASPEAK